MDIGLVPRPAVIIPDPEQFPRRGWKLLVDTSLIGPVPRDILAAWLALEAFCRAKPTCFPSNAKLAERMGVTTKQAVQALLARLEALGIAERVHEEGNRRTIRLLRRVADPLGPAEWEAMVAAAEDAAAARADDLVDDLDGVDEADDLVEVADVVVPTAPAPALLFSDRGPIEDGPRGPSPVGPKGRKTNQEEEQQHGAVVVADLDQVEEPESVGPEPTPEAVPIAGPPAHRTTFKIRMIRRVQGDDILVVARRLLACLEGHHKPPGPAPGRPHPPGPVGRSTVGQAAPWPAPAPGSGPPGG